MSKLTHHLFFLKGVNNNSQIGTFATTALNSFISFIKSKKTYNDQNFRDKYLEKFWLSKGTIHVKCVPPDSRQATYRKLRELNQAKDSRDLRNTPGSHGKGPFWLF